MELTAKQEKKLNKKCDNEGYLCSLLLLPARSPSSIVVFAAFAMDSMFMSP